MTMAGNPAPTKFSNATFNPKRHTRLENDKLALGMGWGAAGVCLLLSLDLTAILINGWSFPDPARESGGGMVDIALLGLCFFFLAGFAAGIVFLFRLFQFRKLNRD